MVVLPGDRITEVAVRRGFTVLLLSYKQSLLCVFEHSLIYQKYLFAVSLVYENSIWSDEVP